MAPRAARVSGVGNAATSGFVWLVVQSFAARGIGFFTQLILARLLMPADFGIIGLALTVTTIANSLIGFGIDEVLLQRQQTISHWETPGFWLSVGISFIGMLGMFAAAPLASSWYHAPGLTGLIIAIAIATPLRAIATVPTAKIRAEMDFRFLAVYNTFDIFTLQILTVIFAACGMGAYAFALPYPIVGAFRAIWFWRRSSVALNRRFRVVQVKYLLGNSTLVLCTRVLNELINQGDFIVLGIIASKVQVGYYFFAFRFAAQPVRMLAGNVMSVIFPALAQYRNEPTKQIAALVRACRLLAYLVMPVCFLQAALAQPGLHLLFGERWMPAVPYVVILSVGLPFDAMIWLTGSLLSARREFGKSLILQSMAAPLFYVMVIAGGHLGSVMGVAIGVALFYFVWPPATSFLVLMRNGVSWRTVSEFYVGPALFSGLAAAIGIACARAPYIRNNDFARCVVIGLVMCVVYGLMLRIFKRDMILEITSRFSGLTSRFRKRTAT